MPITQAYQLIRLEKSLRSIKSAPILADTWPTENKLRPEDKPEPATQSA